ncbi:hypothetical protein Cme02nite_66120 [Catellatospora methionotrophica]|uniref:LTD domain-containing protein n=1 Tax=Catellatospora methionotrophica TaxID=121620 RepID=A0A8J3LPB3_9ACTN|nr:lamin tail domain-containing protein [Catellatospora methionotrophica]GIG18280.1 hypothetical protein Cme02nite_66120 [Catellatospora methionotrophica]
MRQWVRRAAAVAVVSLSAGVAGLLQPVPALAVSPDIVISQVYGGGGSVGATYTNDFVELFNRGASAVDVTGWSVQYAGAVGSAWQTTPLTGTIQPGSYYLVQEGQGMGGTTPLPTPDAVDDIAMSAISGKVALVTTQTDLTCSIGCDTASGVRDFVGYGITTSSETLPTPVLSVTTAALREDGGDADTDNNAVDFAVGAPHPRSGAQAPDEANLSVTKTDSPDPVTAGSNLTYTIAVRNNGPDAAQTVVLRDEIPAGTSFVSFTSPAGWAASTPPVGGTGEVSATKAAVGNGETATFTLVVAVAAGTTGTISNSSGVTSATFDPVTADNGDTERTDVGPGTPVCTITGTERGDILNGTLGDDVICGLGGDDIISGLGGNDVVYGGPGSDLINGGPGDDMVYGEAGHDFIKIRDKVAGNDNADGGPGFDLCSADLLDAVLSCP